MKTIWGNAEHLGDNQWRFTKTGESVDETALAGKAVGGYLLVLVGVFLLVGWILRAWLRLTRSNPLLGLIVAAAAIGLTVVAASSSSSARAGSSSNTAKPSVFLVLTPQPQPTGKSVAAKISGPPSWLDAGMVIEWGELVTIDHDGPQNALMGRIGDAEPFTIAKKIDFHAPGFGRLYLSKNPAASGADAIQVHVWSRVDEEEQDEVPPDFKPYWVANHTPAAPMWSSPAGVVQPGSPVKIFASTSQQFCVFEVRRPQKYGRLYVYNPYSGDYFWVNASDVGPIPEPDRGQAKPPNQNCAGFRSYS